MRIAVMSTWNQICGISDYSMSLVGNYPKDSTRIIAPKLETGTHHSLFPVGPEFIKAERLFNATIWDGIVNIELDKVAEVAEWADVFHIQFQDALYHHEWLYHLVQRLKGRTKLVITLHDSCLGKIWPMLNDFDHVITMKPEVKAQVPQAILTYMPIHYRTPVLKGFGLGRSKHHEIELVCNELGYDYQYTKAEDKWMPIDELLSWLRDSDGIVLYYDEVGTAGSSAGAKTALSTRRPVFLNRVTWFNDVDESLVTKFNDDEDLKNKLFERFNNSYLNDNSFEKVAETHINIYSN